MRLHRFYVGDKMGGEKLGNKTEFSVDSAELANQIRRVFRLKNGDHVVVFDGSGFDFECELGGSGAKGTSARDTLAFRIISSERSHYMPTGDMHLCAAVTKKDTFEWIVEKATELGVTKITPVLAERSEKKALNMERLNKIVIEASEQSGRGDVPEILPITKLEEAIDLVSDAKAGEAKSIVFHTEGENFEREDDKPTVVFIGPEGGWSPDELDLFKKKGIEIRCLGPQILRAETAVASALSLIMLGK